MMKLTFHDKRESIEISLEKDKAEWLIKTLDLLHFSNEKVTTFSQVKADFETQFEDFELFWHSKPLNTLRERNLLLL